MKGKDSYPPKSTGDSGSTVEVDDLPEVQPETEKSEPISEENDEARKPGDWDGSEAEIVVDDEAEEYEDETTGIKIKYTLKPEEVRSFIRHSEGFRQNRKAQRKHTVIQNIVFVAMIILAIATGSEYYKWLAVFPVIALFIMWLVPFFGMKKLIRELFKNEEMSVEIFPDKIEIEGKTQCREIPLDGSCESEEFDDMIMIFSKDGPSLLVPLRAVEPEFQADVQAMLLAGAKPRYKN